MLDISKEFIEPWCVEAIRCSFTKCTFARLAPEILDKKSCKDIEFEVDNNITHWCDVKAPKVKNFGSGKYSLQTNEIHWLSRNMALNIDNDYKSRHWIALNYPDTSFKLSQEKFDEDPHQYVSSAYTKKFFMFKSSELIKARYIDIVEFYYKNPNIANMFYSKSDFNSISHLVDARKFIDDRYDLMSINDIEDYRLKSTIIIESDVP